MKAWRQRGVQQQIAALLDKDKRPKRLGRFARMVGKTQQQVKGVISVQMQRLFIRAGIIKLSVSADSRPLQLNGLPS